MTKAAPEELVAGTERYQLVDALRPIGQGGLALVYEAVKLSTGERVAIKILRSEFAHEHQRKRSQREDERLAKLAALDHPNIVKRFASGMTSLGQPFIVMELLKGKNLAERLARGGAMPFEEAAEVVCDVLRGLHAIHREGLVHRDLKLENIFLQESVVPKILDFGLAKDVGPDGANMTALTAKGVALGTPRFMSPEQAQGAAVDCRSDLYSLGWILFSLVTGRLPFDEIDGHEELMIAHAIRPPELPSSFVRGVPAEIDEIVLKALRKDPEQRFQTALEMAKACFRASRCESTKALPTSLATGASFVSRPAQALPPGFGGPGLPVKTIGFLVVFLTTVAAVAAGLTWLVGRSGR